MFPEFATTYKDSNGKYHFMDQSRIDFTATWYPDPSKITNSGVQDKSSPCFIVDTGSDYRPYAAYYNYFK